jgi:hypothetical protein
LIFSLRMRSASAFFAAMTMRRCCGRAVAQGRREGVFPPRSPFALLVEVGLDVGEKRVHALGFVRMDEDARALVDKQEVFVLIDDVERRAEDRQKRVFRRGCIEKLVVT